MAIPVAVAGAKQTLAFDALPTSVALSSAGSTADAGRSIVSYAWTLIEIPEGSTAVLSSSTAAAPTFTADKPGTYMWHLRVTDDAAEVSAPRASAAAASLGIVTVKTQELALEAPAFLQPDVSRPLQANLHTLDAAIRDIRGQLGAVIDLSGGSIVFSATSITTAGTITITVTDGGAEELYLFELWDADGAQEEPLAEVFTVGAKGDTIYPGAGNGRARQIFETSTDGSLFVDFALASGMTAGTYGIRVHRNAGGLAAFEEITVT